MSVTPRKLSSRSPAAGLVGLRSLIRQFAQYLGRGHPQRNRDARPLQDIRADTEPQGLRISIGHIREAQECFVDRIDLEVARLLAEGGHHAFGEIAVDGEVRREDFTGFEHVFTGHFHKRQTQRNITYIGNCFPHNYADAGDDERGALILEWGQEPEFHAWPDQPTYRVLNLSDVIDNAPNLLKPKMHVRVGLDIEISYEEANFIKETFIKDYHLAEMALVPNKNSEIDTDMAPGNIKFESVDQIVIDQLSNIESEFYDSKLLLKIYQTL